MNTSKFSIRMLVPILLCLFAMGHTALAQVTNASLNGVVTDANGAALPGVQIHVQNTDTNFVQSAETNASGVYLVIHSFRAPTRSQLKRPASASWSNRASR